MDQLVVALDVQDGVAALALGNNLRDVVGAFKVGSRLFTTEGPDIVRTLAANTRVFLDLKFHDIPNTVATAVAAATSLGVWMVNVHASGGTRMMQAARDAARETAARERRHPPLVIAVTVLTSMNEAMLDETGVHTPVLDQVLRLADLSQAAGLDGVVASPLETPLIRKRCGPDFTIVTPGIRGGAAADGATGTSAKRGGGIKERRPGANSGAGRSHRRRRQLHCRRETDHRRPQRATGRRGNCSFPAALNF